MKVISISGPLPRPDRPGSLAPVARQMAAVRSLGVTVDPLEIRGTRKLKYVAVIPELRRRSRSADLIHAHFGYSGWIALAQSRVPFVISFMGSDLLGSVRDDGSRPAIGRAELQINRWVAGQAGAVIVKSNEMARILGPVRAAVIPNGVNLDSFRPLRRDIERARLGWPPDELAALFPGCPDFPNKGFPIAQAAAERAAGLLGRPVNLRVLWGVPPEDVPCVMNASDAMILASRREGSPNVIKEALACEIPVVSTRVGDVPDLLAGLDGCWLSERDAPSLGEALASALTFGRLEGGRKRIEERGLDQETVARRIVKIYDAVLAERRGR